MNSLVYRCIFLILGEGGMITLSFSQKKGFFYKNIYNSLYRYLHIFGESQQVVIGDGGLSCTSGSNKQHGLFMCYISLQEEDLTSCLRGLDNQVTDLDKENKINSAFIKSKIIFHKHILRSLKTCFSKTINYCF